jgi:hypothetical protein
VTRLRAAGSRVKARTTALLLSTSMVVPWTLGLAAILPGLPTKARGRCGLARNITVWAGRRMGDC